MMLKDLSDVLNILKWEKSTNDVSIKEPERSKLWILPSRLKTANQLE